MIKLYICCSVLIIGSVEVGPGMDMKFHQEVMEIVSYDIDIPGTYGHIHTKYELYFSNPVARRGVRR